MYSPRKTSISSALGAICAAALLTVVTAIPEVVHAQTSAKPCAEKVSGPFVPSLQ